MDILRDSQLVIFSHSTIFITFSYRSLAGFLFKLLQSSRRRRPEVALDFCVWPLCASGLVQHRRSSEVRDSRTSRHSAHVQSPVWQIWLVLVSIYCVFKAIQKRNVVGPARPEVQARGRDSWCWPKGARPLGTRMIQILLIFNVHKNSPLKDINLKICM